LQGRGEGAQNRGQTTDSKFLIYQACERKGISVSERTLWPQLPGPEGVESHGRAQVAWMRMVARLERCPRDVGIWDLGSQGLNYTEFCFIHMFTCVPSMFH
jgi:hypothetical protein